MTRHRSAPFDSGDRQPHRCGYAPMHRSRAPGASGHLVRLASGVCAPSRKMNSQHLIVEPFPSDRLLVEDAVAGLDELPTDEDGQHYDRENNLSCHFSWLPGLVCSWHFKRSAHKLELRVSERAHFGNVEPLQFGR